MDLEFAAMLLYGIPASQAYIASQCSHRVTHTQLANGKRRAMSPAMRAALERAAIRIGNGEYGYRLRALLMRELRLSGDADTGVQVDTDVLDRLAVLWLARALQDSRPSARLKSARLLTALVAPGR